MIHPNAGNPILVLIMALIMGCVVYAMMTAKTDGEPLGGDDHSEPF